MNVHPIVNHLFYIQLTNDIVNINIDKFSDKNLISPVNNLISFHKISVQFLQKFENHDVLKLIHENILIVNSLYRKTYFYHFMFRFRKWTMSCKALAFITLVSGAFVAGRSEYSMNCTHLA